MPPPAAGISGLFALKKSRNSFTLVDDHELQESQSITQVVSATLKDDSHVPLSSSKTLNCSGDLEYDAASHISGLFEPSDGGMIEENGQTKEHRRQASSASARLPDIEDSSSFISRQSKTHESYQDPTTDNTCESLQSSTQETNSTQAALDLAKADLLRTTDDKRALKLHIRQQDEEIPKLKNRSPYADQGRQFLQSDRDFEAQSVKIIEPTETNSKLEAEIEVIKAERKSLREVVEDTKRQLTAKTTQLEEAIRNSNNLKFDELLLAKEASHPRLKQLEFRISVLTTQKDAAEHQVARHRHHAESLQRQMQSTQDQSLYYESEAANLRSLLESRDADLISSQTQIHELEATIYAKDLEIAQFSSLVQQKEDAERQMGVFREYAETLSRESEAERERAELAEKEATRYREYAQGLGEQSQANLDNYLAVEAESVEVRSLLESTASAFADAKAQLAAVQEERESWQGHMAAMASDFSDAKTQLAVVQEERETWQSRIDAMAADFADAKMQLAAVQEERETWQGRMDAMTSDFAHVKIQLAALQEERETWQGRMDAMMHRVVASERRVRMLYYGAQSLDTPYAGNANAKVRRVRNFARPDNPSAEIMEAVLMLNVAILSAATDITPVLCASVSRSATWTGNSRRAEAVLGEWVSGLLRHEGNWYRTQLLEPVIQMFLVDWCRAIIEAWYPKQQSFAELFVTGLSSCGHNFAGAIQFQAIQTSPNTGSPNFGSWAAQILDDLLDIIPTPHLNPRDCEHILLPSLMFLVQYAYDIRVALAEDDICGNLQLLVPPSDIQFQADSMNCQWVGGVSLEIGKRAPEEAGDVVGCTSLGLQRVNVRKSEAGASFVGVETILAPNVVLARDLTSLATLR